MKKTVCHALCALTLFTMLLGIVTGCSFDKTDKEREKLFMSDNEIFTYDKIVKEKTQLIVSRTGNISPEGFISEFEKANPDIQVIYLDITGGSSYSRPAVDWVKHGIAPDVMIIDNTMFTDEMYKEYFTDFSASPVMKNYETDALNRVAIEGRLYKLPGPSNINCMLYNKTLFEKYNWEVPVTFDDFVALCLKIEADTNGEIEAWNPNAKYTNELLIALEAFTYAEVFGGVDNRTWYNNFTEGNGSFSGHMEPYYEVIKTLADNGILKEEHFTYSATTRGKEFNEGKIAMINAALAKTSNNKYEFGYMPYPTTTGETGYINDTFSCILAVPKKEHSEKVSAAVNRFIEYFSSVDGQKAFIGNTLMLSNVKNVSLNQTEGLSLLDNAIKDGHLFEMFDFGNKQKRINFSLHTDAFNITKGLKTPEECISEVDREPYTDKAFENTDIYEILGNAPQDMTILETSFYIADMYREKASADIALITNNEAYCGNLMRVFKGDITAANVTVLKPRSFGNNTKLVKVSMTGKQLVDAMNTPVTYDNAPANCIYAYSGLKCEIAPWRDIGSKYISITLADGTRIDLSKLYTVTFWEGTVDDAYITETIEIYDGTWEEHMTAKIKADGTIKPADDGRISLIWD